MNSLKVLSAAAAVALMLPLASPSFAQGRPAAGGGGGAHFGGGGGAHFGGGGGPRMGGGFAAGPRVAGGGAGFAAGAAMRPSAGVAMRPGAGATFGGGRPVAAAGGNWHGGGGNWSGNRWHHRGGGFWPGFAAGAAIGGLGSYAYYGGGYYDDPYYYGDSYYDEPSVAVVPDTGGDSSAYCAQRYKSYDPASGTYLGYDGQRHPCP
ncbi:MULTISPECIES: BA14K family protein [unclassified Bradyrhizobium]|uniref:BA14K family protein n=1 Tax=unclassified Bradyrhizobium TaxID=2631580 RepID=UPI0024B25668|nr:BA14K family protein [Bradyrhizobium sp. CB2312]WFU68871.1 BA14K family protein [Bradyrhizobium sp. CB2312]